MAYINLERGPIEGNVPIESGASSRGQTGVGQEGRAINCFFDTILCSPLPRNA